MAVIDRLSWARSAGSRLTTPLHPDDYTRLLHPLWTARELRGRIEKVVPETEDAATVVIRPGWGWRFDHRPGQYVGIGVQVDGKFHWRSYSLSTPPKRRGRTIAITVRAMPEGFLSKHLVEGLAPGTIVRLALPAGDFVLPDPPPAKMLFLVGGSGITPVMSMLRTLDRRGSMPDVSCYSSPTPERMIFGDELARLEAAHPSFRVHRLHTDTDGMLELADLDHLVPDWRGRETWACGPGPMLDAIGEHFEAADLEDQLHVERFSLDLGNDGGEGGTITFQSTGKSAEVDGATTVLEAGEEAGIGMPYGCRMGICHTCTLTLVSGTVRDLRNGDEYDDTNDRVQTCVTRPYRHGHSTSEEDTDGHQRRQGSTPTSPRRRSSSSAASSTPCARRSRSRAATTTRRTSIASSRSSAVSPPLVASPCSPAAGNPPGSPEPRCWAAAKILENMELGHNVMHGQYDWMNDPEIHSSNWEWDTAQPAEQWKHSHNYIHHQFTNVLGHDNDIGYGVLRMAREQKWHPVNLGQPVYNARWPPSSNGGSPCTTSTSRPSASARRTPS